MLHGDAKRRIIKLNRALLIGYLAVALTLVYWGVVRAGRILAREDNPRLVEAELRIARGRILDSNDVVLAESVTDGGRYRRVYPLPHSGPAVGYYSLRHGTAGVENGYDALLRGDSDDFWRRWWQQDVLHATQRGRDVRLTLNANWQTLAENALGERDGAVLLFSLPDAGIRALVSHPTYDPNRLNATFDELVADARAPLLNRATQGLYQPGLVLQPFILASALDRELLTLDEPVDATAEVTINGFTLGCATPPGTEPTWVEALRHGCPAPLLTLVDPLGGSGLLNLWQAWGFASEPPLPIAVDSAELPPLTDPRQAIIGQENLTVTPLQVGLAWIALGQSGNLLPPRLVAALQDEDGAWQALVKNPTSTEPVASAGNAAAVRAALTGADGVITHRALALTGPEGEQTAWFLGMAPATDPRFAVVVVLEKADAADSAEQIGRHILTAVLTGSE